MVNQPQLLRLLNEKQLLKLPVVLPQEVPAPWYIKVLLAFAGWLAALFFFGFIALALFDITDSNIARALVGIALIMIAYFILRAPSQSEFFVHIGLAVSGAGHILIAWALFRFLTFSDIWLLSTLTLSQLLLAWFMPNFLHRIFSAFLAAYFLCVLMTLIGILSLFSSIIMITCACLWLHEFDFSRYYFRCKAIAYGLTLALILAKADFFPKLYWLTASQPQYLTNFSLEEILNCLVLLYVSKELIKRYQIKLTSRAAYIIFSGTILVGLISLQAQGITLAMMLIILSFSASNRLLLGIGIMSGLFYLAHYYYFLDLTLTQKSYRLLMLGLVLLALAKGVTRFKQQEGPKR